jgi:hypothetical protein
MLDQAFPVMDTLDDERGALSSQDASENGGAAKAVAEIEAARALMTDADIAGAAEQTADATDVADVAEARYIPLPCDVT